MTITKKEKQVIQELHLQAFGKEEGPIVFDMVGEMLDDPESISINIVQEENVVGNIIFTPFKLNDHIDKKCYLLAPVGVLSEFHG